MSSALEKNPNNREYFLRGDPEAALYTETKIHGDWFSP